jgi:hypothetical protein
MRVVGDGPNATLGVAAEREARERAIKALLRENRMSPADQAELDNHLTRFRSRSLVRRVVAIVVIGTAALIYRALV